MTTIFQDPFQNFSNWTINSGTPVIGTGRSGGKCAVLNAAGQSIHRLLTVGEQSDTITYGFAFNTSSLAADGYLAGLYGDAGVQLHNNLVVLTTGAVCVTRGTGTTTKIATSATGLVVANTWYYVEVQIKLSDSVGFVTLRLNGTTVASAPSIDTKNSGTVVAYDLVRLTGVGSVTTLYDDFYLKSGAGETFSGDISVTETPDPCVAVLREPFENLANWTGVTNVVITQVAGPRSAARSDASNSVANYTIPTANQSDWITMGFWWHSSTLAADNQMIQLWSDSGVTPHLSFQAVLSGKIQVRRGDIGDAPVPGGVTADGLLVNSTWYFIEIQARLHDTAGAIIIRIDGIERLNLSGIDTKNGGTKAAFDQVRLRGQIGVNEYWDGMYVNTGAGCAFLGNIVTALFAVKTEDFDDRSDWSSAGFNTPLPRTGYTGLAIGAVSSAYRTTFTIPAAQESATMLVGLRFQPINAVGAREVMVFKSDTGVTVHITLVCNSTGGLEVRRGTVTGTVLASSATGLLALDAWHYIEMRVMLHDTTGTVEVHVDGTAVIPATSSLDTKNAGTKVTFDALSLTTSSTRENIIDDLYISTGVDATFLGPQRYGTGPFSVLHESFTDLSAWATVAGSPTFVTGRTGTAVELDSTENDRVVYTIPSGQRSYVTIIGFALFITTGGTASATDFIVTRDASANSLGNLRVSTLGALSTTGIGPSADGVMPTGSWHYIEWFLFAGGTSAGGHIIRVDNVVVSTLVNSNGIGITGSPPPSVATVELRSIGVGGKAARYDDFYIQSGTFADFEGDHVIGALAPTINVYNGSAFVAAPVKVYNGTSYVDAIAVKTWNGSVWV